MHSGNTLDKCDPGCFDEWVPAEMVIYSLKASKDQFWIYFWRSKGLVCFHWPGEHRLKPILTMFDSRVASLKCKKFELSQNSLTNWKLVWTKLRLNNSLKVSFEYQFVTNIDNKGLNVDWFIVYESFHSIRRYYFLYWKILYFIFCLINNNLITLKIDIHLTL